MIDWQEVGAFLVRLLLLAAGVYVAIKGKGAFVRIGTSKNEPWWKREYVFATKTKHGLVHPPIANKSFAQKMRELALFIILFLGTIAVGIFLIKGGVTVLVSVISAVYPSHF